MDGLVIAFFELLVCLNVLDVQVRVELKPLGRLGYRVHLLLVAYSLVVRLELELVEV